MDFRERSRAYAKYNAGTSIRRLAREFGVTYRIMYNTINNVRHYGLVTGKRKRTLDKIIYPGIRDWMQKYGVQYVEIAEKTGMSKTNVREVLTGVHPLKTNSIKLLRALTGLTYEQMIGEEAE